MHGLFRVGDLIQKKRNKMELSQEEVRFFIRELVQGKIEGCQLGKNNYNYLSILKTNVNFFVFHFIFQVKRVPVTS